MALQWLGWRPDVTPQYMQARTAQEALDLRRREVDDRRGSFRDALEDQTWERQFKLKGLEQNWARALLSDASRERVEKGRGERAERMQERLISSTQTREFWAYYNSLSEDAQRALQDTPGFAENMKEKGIDIPVIGRYEKKGRLGKQTGKDVELRKEFITSDLERQLAKLDEKTEGKGYFWGGSDWFGRSEEEQKWMDARKKIEEAAEKKLRGVEAGFEAQFPGVGGPTVVRTGVKDGRPVAEMSDGTTIYTDTGEVVK